MPQQDCDRKKTTSRLYGRRKGRPLHVRKARLMCELLPQLLIVLKGGTHATVQSFFAKGESAPAWMEIGFGGGEHLAAQAKLHPDVLFIGCEPFINGIASLLDHLEKDAIQNVRIFDNDARLMLDALPHASLDKCFVLFADPWPKKRHAERRFIGPENLDRLARVLKSGALLRLASDHASLIEWMHDCLKEHTEFVCVYAGAEPPPDWVETRYQQKALKAGRQPFFMDYRRK
ncbi:MAG: tRNA (guanosine(46)-N7)-methyltransferase TrmB [Alphaproteobacteria bacterium]|nr:tRNA (guanosine(46)-N7)-methyltransferase TrmB [Alphaproteobacteria bacterium]